MKTIHFISDCPATQYRIKQNFCLLSSLIYKYRFQRTTWNFSEARHGKGPADGIGASIKRQADQHANVKGEDIVCAKDLTDGLATSTTNVKFFLVKENEISEIEKLIPSLSPIPGTVQIQQVLEFY